MLLKIDLSALGSVRQHWKGVGVTLFVNWAVKPFSMAALGTFFLSWLFAPLLTAAEIQSYIAGLTRVTRRTLDCPQVSVLAPIFRAACEAPARRRDCGNRRRQLMDLVNGAAVHRIFVQALEIERCAGGGRGAVHEFADSQWSDAIDFAFGSQHGRFADPGLAEQDKKWAGPKFAHSLDRAKSGRTGFVDLHPVVELLHGTARHRSATV